MAPVEAFKTHGADFVVRSSLRELVAGMNAIPDTRPLRHETIEDAVRHYDEQVTNPNATDQQVLAVRAARAGYLGDRLMRVASPRPILDPGAGPLIAVKLHVLTRKSLGGCETDLSARALGNDGSPIPGLYAVGEAAGFGGGGVHGYRALEGTFLGGCLFTGRVAGRAVAQNR
jgi:predicted oxidoreductase